MNANDRVHWSKRANATATIRSVARGQAKGIPRLQRVKIRAIYKAPDNRRRDVSNLFPSVKAAVDGLVDAGVLQDDNDRYVKSLEMTRSPDNVRGGQLIIEIIDLDEVKDGECV